MRTVRLTLDEALVKELDKVAKKLGTTRLAFARAALRAALAYAASEEEERRHRSGYERKPVRPGEFSDWEDEQVWVD
ncbi:MAG: ribbon-helix-helix protein, CopG family [Desulfurellaceae bacterium]|nr:ribbon-helix-helix protein, CopG family [Desulfurellaceae bacterium]